MRSQGLSFSNSRYNYAVLVISIALAMFWLVGKNIDIYRFILVGVVYEIFWLPVLAMLFGLPLLCAWLFWRDKFNRRSLALYAFIISLFTLIILVSLG